MNKKHLAYIILPVLGISLLTGGVVMAASDSISTIKKPFTGLAQAIATKFNLSEVDVQSVIDEAMKNGRAEMKKNCPNENTRLTQAVTDGKITQAQADLIKAKHEELQTVRKDNMEKMKTMTATEREAAMNAEKESLQKWAKDNNIPEEFAGMYGGGHGRGPGGMGHIGTATKASADSASK